MNWLLIATLAQFVLGTSAVFDKFLLKRKFFDPVVYTFWLGFLGIFAVVFLPFGFQIISINIIGVAFLAGAIFVLAILFLFYGLEKSDASQILPAIGGISPIFTLIIGYFILGLWLGAGDLTAFLFLILGALIFFAIEKKESRKIFFVFVVLSAFFFGLSNILSKIVFSAGNFITGFFWIKLGGLIFVLLFLLSGKIRKNILDSSRQSRPRHRFLYLSNRIYAGIGSVLVSFAISLSYSPALVDVTHSLKYVVIFIFAWILLKEKFKGKILFWKIFATLLVCLGIFFLAVINYARSIPINENRTIIWGLTYSTKFTSQLGLDWQKTYSVILEELKPKKVRLIAYWDEIEKEEGNFDFSKTDWLVEKSAQADAKIILTLGMKVPRWPECHEPEWVQSQISNLKTQNLLNYLKEIVNRYKNEPNLYAWQVENEPFLAFGECPTRDAKVVREEVALVKSLDNSRPVILTDSGEFGLWYKAAKMGDIFGTTMYRNVYIKGISRIFGNIDYPLGPEHFRIKEKIIRFLLKDNLKRFIVIELQAEPWSRVGLEKISYEEQINLFSPDYFSDTIEYARETGFDEYYLWGAEWWYYLREKHNDSRYWELARKVISNQ